MTKMKSVECFMFLVSMRLAFDFTLFLLFIVTHVAKENDSSLFLLANHTTNVYKNLPDF